MARRMTLTVVLLRPSMGLLRMNTSVRSTHRRKNTRLLRHLNSDRHRAIINRNLAHALRHRLEASSLNVKVSRSQFDPSFPSNVLAKVMVP